MSQEKQNPPPDPQAGAKASPPPPAKPPAPPQESLGSMLGRVDGKPTVGAIVLYEEADKAPPLPGLVVQVHADGRLNLSVHHNGPVGRTKHTTWAEKVPPYSRSAADKYPRWRPRPN